jgi:hypothetical protein
MYQNERQRKSYEICLQARQAIFITTNFQIYSIKGISTWLKQMTSDQVEIKYNDLYISKTSSITWKKMKTVEKKNFCKLTSKIKATLSIVGCK